MHERGYLLTAKSLATECVRCAHTHQVDALVCQLIILLTAMQRCSTGWLTTHSPVVARELGTMLADLGAQQRPATLRATLLRVLSMLYVELKIDESRQCKPKRPAKPKRMLVGDVEGIMKTLPGDFGSVTGFKDNLDGTPNRGWRAYVVPIGTPLTNERVEELREQACLFRRHAMAHILAKHIDDGAAS